MLQKKKWIITLFFLPISVLWAQNKPNNTTIDSVWLNKYPYFQVWNNYIINPYGLDIASLKEPTALQLFDITKGELWSPPLLRYEISSYFGMRGDHFHQGIDLAVRTGAKILSTFDGIVRIASYDDGGFGNFVVIRHLNGLETLYGHLSYLRVKVGQVVKAGEVIGLVGSTGLSTGPHLHFGVLYLGYFINPNLIFDFKDAGNIKNRKAIILPQHFAHLGNNNKLIIKYKVAKGETLKDISRKYEIPSSEIAQVNQLKTKELKEGQILVIKF
jgi:murein DD-endopeptidase MepM/ murein hydrolase activator NlpD